MNLDKIAARLRPRSSYEATDLGVVLARHFWKPLLVGWLACVLPVVAGAAVISAMTPLFWLPLLMVWWLKPLYDRVPLFVLSRAFFGDVPSLGRTIGYAMRSWRSGAAIADITWRRFNPYRAVAMPVRELEKLGGAEARQRLKTLFRRDVQGPALWLVVVCIAVELMLVGAILAVVGMVIPEAADFHLGSQIDTLFDTHTNAPWTELAAYAMYFAAMTAVEIAYVAASFGLYINRRIRLEGWDIEIVFKRLASRLRARAQSAVRAAGVLLAVGAVGLLAHATPVAAQTLPAQTQSAQTQQAPTYPPEAHHQPGGVASAQSDSGPRTRTVEPSAPPADPQDEIDDILQAPEFGSTKTEERWQLRDDLFNRDEKKRSKADLSWLEQIVSGIAQVFQVLMWVLAGVVLIGGIYYIVKKVRVPQSTGAASPEAAALAELHDVPEEAPQVTLPANIVEAAIAAWRDGDRPRSLSLLYRGTVSGLAGGYRIKIDPSMTARECAGKVREAGGPADYVAELARAWTATVYADRPISDEEANRLFDAWKQHFRPSMTRSRGGRR